MYSTRPGTCTVPAKVTVTSPTATGTGVSVHDHQTALRIDDEAGAVIVCRSVIPDTEYGMSNVTRASEGASAFSRVLEVRECVETHGHGLGWGPAGSCLQSHRPEASSDRNGAREPQSIHADGAQLAVVGIVDGDVAHRSALAVGELRDPRLEFLQGVGLSAVDRHDHRAAGNARRAEHVAGVGDYTPRVGTLKCRAC